MKIPHYKLKSLIRCFIGHCFSSLPYSISNQPKIYINLHRVGAISGPGRFLRNFISVLKENNISISNWSLRRCRSALVFSSSWGNSFSALCRRLKVRSVLRVDGFYVPEIYGSGKKRLLGHYQKWINGRLREDIEKFDHVVYQSAFSKEQADLHLYNRTSNYSIIHNGVDVQFFTPQPYVKRDARPTIIVLGKHYPENLVMAINIFKRVRLAIDALLLIVGPMRDGSENVKNYVLEYLKGDNIGKDIICLGTIPYDKLPETLAQADIYLHVKIGDCCPNSVAEALSCGLPVVCPSWGGTKELIGQGGISVDGPPWGTDDNLYDGMADAVLEILRKQDFYKSNARKRAIEKLDKYLIATQYIRVLGFEK